MGKQTIRDNVADLLTAKGFNVRTERLESDEHVAKLCSLFWREFKYNLETENKAQLLAIGYDDTLAAETAEAMVNGELDKVFANQKKHMEAVRKEIRSEILKETPKPGGGNSDKPMTKEEFRKMSSQERYEFSVNHPEEYKQLYGGNG